jgi:hypothetical protein
MFRLEEADPWLGSCDMAFSIHPQDQSRGLSLPQHRSALGCRASAQGSLALLSGFIVMDGRPKKVGSKDPRRDGLLS